MSAFYLGGRSPAGTNLTIVLIAAVAAARPAVHQIIIGSEATPADVSTRFFVLRHTVAATGGTSFVARPADPGGASVQCTPLAGTMTEPTYEGTPLLEVALNQRATFTWIANPGRELKCPLGTANGIGVRSVLSTGTPIINVTMGWDE